MNGKTRTALRSTLQKEDEALNTRLPDAADVEPAVIAEAAPEAAPEAVTIEAVVVDVVTETVADEAPVTAAELSKAPAKPKTAARRSTKAPAKPAAATLKAKAAAPATVDKAAKPVKLEKPAKTDKVAKVEKIEKAVDKSAEKIADKAEKPVKAPRDKVVRDSFSMPKSEHAQLKVLRETLARAGRICTKSELLRVGMQLLMKEPAAGVKALVEGLTAVPKGKSAK